MTEWLEEYLRRGSLSLLMVTHDRYFLDRVCSEIMEIDNKQIYSYKGNYSYYLEKRQERIDATNTEIMRANNLYRTELEWMRRMPQARGHKARYREEAFYELEKVAKQRFDNRQVKLDAKASYIGSKIFEAEHLYKSFGDLKILEDFSYIFARYEKMGIVGDNGTGKSTFIKILMGEQKPDSGTLDIGETVRFGYYSQEGLKFDEQMKVIDVVQDIAEVIELGGGRKLTASQFLQHFLFTPEQQHNYVYKLSGGEKRRLYLCTVLMRNPNFLVLDEPTNDLDIITLQVLEEYLQNFNRCVMVVSHDRYFMDKVVDHLLVFKGQGDIRDFPVRRTPDLTVSLHACDIATDIVLAKGIDSGSRVILSTPCCHHEMMHQLKPTGNYTDFLLEHSILKQKFADAATDALRCKVLEINGYDVTALELIDPEETPKNVLIRGVKRNKINEEKVKQLKAEYNTICDILGIAPYLQDGYCK
jgi:ATP-binding cassette subfamily F protein uup